MPRATFLIPTVRPDMMIDLAESWVAQPWADEYDAVVIFQDFEPRDVDEVMRILDTRLRAARFAKKQPPYPLRRAAYAAHPDVHTWILLDDDMVFTSETNFAPAVAKAQEPYTGLVSCNWIRTDSAALRKRAVVRDEFIKQPIVNTSGGVAMTRKIANLVIADQPKHYLFDDVQLALMAYLAGYDNYRYRGSLLIHRITHKGGLQKTYREQPFVPPDPTWIQAERSKIDKYPWPDNNLLMPGSRHLTALSKERHRDARKRLERRSP